MSCQRPFSRLVACAYPDPPDRFCCCPVSGPGVPEGQFSGAFVGMAEAAFNRGSCRKRSSRSQARVSVASLVSRSTRTSYWPLSWQEAAPSSIVR